MQEDTFVKFVTNRRDASMEGTQYKRFISNFDTYKRAYAGKFKTRLPDNYSQFFVPLAFQTVDSILAYFYEALFNQYPLATYMGRQQEDMVKAQSMQHVMDYLVYKQNFIDRMLAVLQWVLKYGTVVTYNYYRYQVEQRMVMENREVFPGITVREKTKRPMVIYDNPSFRLLDTRYFYPDPNAGSIESLNGLSVDMRYAGHEEYTDFATLVADKAARGYKNLDKLLDHIKSRMGVDSGNKDNLNFEDSQDPYRKRIKLLHMWTPLDFRFIDTTSHTNISAKTFDPTMHHVIIAEDAVAIFMEEQYYTHGEIPYEIGNIYKPDDGIYGMSVIETVLSSNEIMNTLVNLRLDNVHNLVNPTPIVYRGALEDKDHFEKPIPGPTYVSFPEDLNKVIKYEVAPDIGSNAYMQMMGQMEDIAIKSSAANPISMGMPFKSKRSATEASSAASSGIGRFKKMSFVFSNSWVQPTLRQFVSLLQQYSTTKMRGAIIGSRPESFVEYSPDEIIGEYDVEVQDATVANKELVSQAYTNFIAAAAPYVQSGMIDPVPLLRGIVQNMPLIKNPDEIIKAAQSLSPDEIAMIQQMAPDVMAAIQQRRAQAQGLGQAATTPGSGFNGGSSSAGNIQPELADTGIKMAV